MAETNVKYFTSYYENIMLISFCSELIRDKFCTAMDGTAQDMSVSRTLRENCQEVGQLSLEGEHKSPSTTRFGGTLMIIFSLILMLVLCFKLRSFKA